MNASTSFNPAELALTAAKDARQCVLIGSQPGIVQALQHLQIFALDEQQPSDPDIAFVRTSFHSEPLCAALERSQFDRLKSSLFVWLGGAGYRTMDAAVAALAFMASLPKGSGVLLDYVSERPALRTLADSALDALSSRIDCAAGGVKHLIQPGAVAAMLRSLGFHQVVDLAQDEGPNFVTALV